MSIWKPFKEGVIPELEEHGYEKTLIGISSCPWSNILVYLDGTKIEYKVKKSDYGHHGEDFNTNTCISFDKQELLNIANSMKIGAKFRVAACDSMNKDLIIVNFKHDNDMIKIGHNQFIPKEKLK